MDLEKAANPDIERREAIAGWQTLAVVDVDTDPHVEELAEEFALLGIKPMDALQVASAIAAGATALLTTDQALLRTMRNDPRLRVMILSILFELSGRVIMRTDVEIRLNGVRALIQALGAVEAERFVALINRKRFDYTEWRKTQWPDETVGSLAAKARPLRADGQQEPGRGESVKF